MANRKRFRDLPVKDKLSYGSAVIAFILGWVMTIAAFCTEPVGEVHDSILWILGQALVYTAAVFGIALYAGNSVRSMKRQINHFMRDPNNRRAFEEDVFPEDEIEEGDDNDALQ